MRHVKQKIFGTGSAARLVPKSKQEIKVINPATEEDCAVISLGNKEDINDAVSAAKKAYENWSFSSKDERIKLLTDLSNLLYITGGGIVGAYMGVAAWMARKK